jgi:hypothetical protein
MIDPASTLPGDDDTDDTAPLYQRRRNPSQLAIAFPKETYDARTVIVIGSGRGGTSAVAGAIHALGIRMVEPGQRVWNAEDIDFIRVSKEPRNSEGESRHAAICRGIEELIAVRSSAYRDWGWKDPSAGLYLEAVIHRCRNPLLVFVWRNPFDVAMSLMAVDRGISIEQAMGFAVRAYVSLWELVQRCGVPTLLVSYERAVAQRETFLNELSAFLRIAPSDDRLNVAVEFLSPDGGYRRIGRPGSVL